MQIPDPPPWPFWPITITTVVMATSLYLYRRGVSNRRSVGARVASIAGVVLVFALPTAVLLLAQDSSCSDNEYSSGFDTNWAAFGAMLLLLLGALWLLGIAAGVPMDRVWRLPASVAAALTAGYVFEGFMSLMTLSQYCENSPGPLYLHTSLAVILPLVGLGIAHTWEHD